jgi:hypothetical protein
LQLHEAVGHLAKTAPDILAKPEVARAIEEALVEAMILCLTQGHCVDPPKTESRAKSSSRRENSLNLHSHRDPAIYPHFWQNYRPALWLFGLFTER